jgi:hypothetical protein
VILYYTIENVRASEIMMNEKLNHYFVAGSHNPFSLKLDVIRSIFAGYDRLQPTELQWNITGSIRGSEFCCKNTTVIHLPLHDLQNQ